jgi:tRNA pseudouridine38-40 synthase
VAVIRLDLAYDGSGFRGFARQPRVRTIEGVLVDALERVLGRRPRLSVAGRTDAGVHAEGQVVSFETDVDASPVRIRRALNGMLSPEVVILRARHAPEGFDARRSATARHYRYRVRAGEVPNPFTARYEWHRTGTYRLAPMRAAARHLVGTHDFTSFCRPAPGRSTVRTLHRLTVRRAGDLLEVRASADGFLHQMVRSIAGTLLAVGEARIHPEAIPGILEARSRAEAGPVAPPDGLVLVSVTYGPQPETRARSRTSGEA